MEAVNSGMQALSSLKAGVRKFTWLIKPVSLDMWFDVEAVRN